MRYRVSHRTAYTYAEPVDLGYHALRLSPRAFEHQQVIEAAITCVPNAVRTRETLDHFGNTVTFLTFDEPHDTFTVESRCVVDVAFPAPPAPELTPAWEDVRQRLWGNGFPDLIEAVEFVAETRQTPIYEDVIAYAAVSFPAGQRLLTGLLDLTRRIHSDFTFDPAASDVSTPLIEVMRNRRGVCQDFAHVQIACLRTLGLAARYVSGYIRTRRAEGEAHAGADASHAWVSAYCPDFGWIDVDPTNNLVVSDEHVVLAWGRDYSDVSPVRGVILGGGAHTLAVAVDMGAL